MPAAHIGSVQSIVNNDTKQSLEHSPTTLIPSYSLTPPSGPAVQDVLSYVASLLPATASCLVSLLLLLSL